MKTIFYFVIIGIIAGAVQCLPRKYYYSDDGMLRLRRSPVYGMRYTEPGQGFILDAHLNEECQGCGEPQDYPEQHGIHGEIPLQEYPHETHIHEHPHDAHGHETPADIPEHNLEEAGTHIHEHPVHAPAAKDDSDEDDDEDDSFSILKSGKSNRPFFNFFPIMLGGGRSGLGGGSTAIANSFSTGRKGVATSSATSFGSLSPELRQLLGNGGHLGHQ